MSKKHQPPFREASTRQAPARELSARIPDAGCDHHDDEVPIKAFLAPKELYDHIVEAGVVKSRWRWDKQIAMGLIAAFYIGFSYTTMMVVGGQIPTIQHEHPGIYNLVLGCFGFPLGLFMICVVGADLFTSDCAYMMTAYWEGRIRWYDVARSWIVAWWVNLAGSIIMALIVYWAWIFDGRSDFTLYYANKKTLAPFGACLCKGILANWLVNLAVWIANSAQDITGKAVGIFLPISAFIAMGGEHCIANQFLFSLAKLLGSDLPISTIITRNLIPSTIGNIIGGAFFVSTMYGFAVGTLFDTTYAKTGHAYRRANSCMGCGRRLPDLEPTANNAARAAKQQAPARSQRRTGGGSSRQDNKLYTALHRAFLPRTAAPRGTSSQAAEGAADAAPVQDGSLVASPEKEAALLAGGANGGEDAGGGGGAEQGIPAARGLSASRAKAVGSAAEIYHD